MKTGIIGYGRMGKLYHEVLNELEFELKYLIPNQKTFHLNWF